MYVRTKPTIYSTRLFHPKDGFTQEYITWYISLTNYFYVILISYSSYLDPSENSNYYHYVLNHTWLRGLKYTWSI